MNKVREIFFYALVVLSIFLIAIYSLFVFAVPKIVNSNSFQKKVIELVQTKTNFKLNITKLNLIVNYNLSSKLTISNLELNNSENNIAQLNNVVVDFNCLKLIPKKISAENIYFDKTKLPIKKKNKKNKINLKKIPELSIQNGEIKLDNNTVIKIKDLTTKNKIAKANIIIKTKYINDEIIITEDNKIIIDKNEIKTDNLKIKLLNSEIFVSGILFNSNKEFNFNIKSNNIKTKYLYNAFLFFNKKKNPNKKNFIENFNDFDGVTEIDLAVQKNSITGFCNLKNLQMKFIKFSIPFKFKEAKFNFNKDKINLLADGLAGEEKVTTSLYITNLFNKSREVKGSTKINLNHRFVTKYIKDADVKGIINAEINYLVKNKQVEVSYLFNLDKGTDLIYKKTRLGLENSKRRIYAKTLKIKDTMYIKAYDYSIMEVNNIQKILFGDGIVKKENNKFNLEKITCRTDGKAPVYLIWALKKFVNTGFFEGNLTYYNKTNKLIGNFNLYDSNYKNFHVDNASIKADNNLIIVNAKGTFENAPYFANISLKNGFDNVITVHNLDVYLKEYTIRRNKNKVSKKPKLNEETKEKIKTIGKNINWSIENGILRLDKLMFEKIILENLSLSGFARENMVYFNMPNILFANGSLRAEGIYDFNFDDSDIKFEAQNIDSNSAATMVFNLSNQIEGKANAKMQVNTYNKLELINANASFSIEDGSLTKLGNTDFLIKKSNKIKRNIKFKITDIINVDAQKINSIKSNIKGSLDMHDDELKNIKIYSKQKYLSLYANGNFNIETEQANFNLFGKYNRDAQKGIRVLYIPLSWITKFVFKVENSKAEYLESIKQIPKINANKNEEEIFMVKLNGNLNNAKNLNIKMKRLK